MHQIVLASQIEYLRFHTLHLAFLRTIESVGVYNMSNEKDSTFELSQHMITYYQVGRKRCGVRLGVRPLTRLPSLGTGTLNKRGFGWLL